MLDFKPICTDMLAECKEVLRDTDVRLCDYAPGCISIWGRYFDMRGCIEGNMFFSVLRQSDGADSYALPVGRGSFDDALDAIEKDARERNVPLRFCCIPEEYVVRIRERFGEPVKIVFDGMWSDYLYPYENFCGYKGKALHGQKNHVNRFMREHPDYKFIPMDTGNIFRAREFMLINRPSFDKDEELAEAELRNLDCIFDVFDALKLSGGMLCADNRVLGFTIGEALGDTLHIHVEKALTDFPGAYQMLAMSYAEHMKNDSLRFINRQDDAGDEGLRKSKQNYKPCRMLDKYQMYYK